MQCSSQKFVRSLSSSGKRRRAGCPRAASRGLCSHGGRHSAISSHFRDELLLSRASDVLLPSAEDSRKFKLTSGMSRDGSRFLLACTNRTRLCRAGKVSSVAKMAVVAQYYEYAVIVPQHRDRPAIDAPGLRDIQHWLAVVHTQLCVSVLQFLASLETSASAPTTESTSTSTSSSSTSSRPTSASSAAA